MAREEKPEALRPFAAFWNALSRVRMEPGFGVAGSALPEDENGFRLEPKLPGFDAQDVDVLIQRGVLSIAARKERSCVAHGGRVSTRSFRSIRGCHDVPAGVDRERASVELRKGVLSVCLPKTPETRRGARKIQISSRS
jgi:HSP20 family protein